ncbi:hypothetical protein E6O75_ATG04451 [Venturia nashicola]|uniref:Uncharacterized protein n=1 Tax=Venturia nashicola TaxID=86259 RepID=A0A4Z1PIF2_9PEZI|nr:hypothetical protein E6O75_ATG04451 [Venturia nashicola]
MDSGPAESASISDPSGKSSLPPMSSMRSLFPGPASKAAPVARHPRLLRWLDIQGCSGGSTRFISSLHEAQMQVTAYSHRGWRPILKHDRWSK